MDFPSLKEKVSSLPQAPGSYIFKDSTGRVVYVGKAKNLRLRVGSYFNVTLDGVSKTAALVNRINDIEFIEVESEFEALILEAELIKKYRPKYNIVLKDDKSHIYIVVRNEKVLLSGKKYLLPKVITARKTELQKKDVVFGPFPNSSVVKNIMGTVRKVFPFRDCSVGKFNRYKKLGSPCLFGHLKLCSTPCLAKNQEGVKDYKKRIKNIEKVLSGGATKLVSEIKKEMTGSAKKQEFEKAAQYRDLLTKFSYVQHSFRDAGEYIDNPYLIEDLSKKALQDMVNFLPIPKKEPKRIECFDISNVSGKEAVGSMVVAVAGKIEKQEYKRFKIRFKETPDDFGMMYEVLFRRLKREVENEKKRVEKKKKKQTSWGKPDLIIVDGGKPQVSAALEVMKDLDFYVPVVGVAKKFETLVYFSDSEFKEITVPKESAGMKLILHLRDEAHRFAQSYHHLLRRKSLMV